MAQRRLPAVTWKLAGSLLRTVYHLEVEGNERIPRRGSCIFVGNHTSHLDIFLLASQLPRERRRSVVPMAAADFFFRNRILAGLSRSLLNAIPIRRDAGHRHELKFLRRELVRNEWSYLMFPEGSRSREGQLGEFRSGVGALVAGTSVAVVPCHISGAFETWPPGRHLPRPRGRLKVSFGDALRFEAFPNRRSGWDEVSAELRAGVERLG